MDLIIMKNTDKVTLTFGQLKRLVKESNESGFYWTVEELYRTKPGPLSNTNFVDDSDTIFDTVIDAYTDGLDYLRSECPDEGVFKLYVLRTGDEPFGYDVDKKIKAAAVKRDGRIIEDHVYGNR